MMLSKPTRLPLTRRRLLLFRQTHCLLEYRPTTVIVKINPLGHGIPSTTAISLREFVLGMKDVPDLGSIRAAEESIMPGT